MTHTISTELVIDHRRRRKGFGTNPLTTFKSHGRNSELVVVTRRRRMGLVQTRLERSVSCRWYLRSTFLFKYLFVLPVVTYLMCPPSNRYCSPSNNSCPLPNIHRTWIEQIRAHHRTHSRSFSRQKNSAEVNKQRFCQ
jgi:hypothetical protein